VSDISYTKAGTIGGTLFVFVANINRDDIVNTIVLSAVGGAVSFVMTKLMKMVISWWRSRKG